MPFLLVFGSAIYDPPVVEIIRKIVSPLSTVVSSGPKRRWDRPDLAGDFSRVSTTSRSADLEGPRVRFGQDSESASVTGAALASAGLVARMLASEAGATIRGTSAASVAKKGVGGAANRA